MHMWLMKIKPFLILPRFGVMLSAKVLCMVFVALDLPTLLRVLSVSLPLGVDPFWARDFTDTIILDNLDSALDKLWSYRRQGLKIDICVAGLVRGSINSCAAAALS